MVPFIQFKSANEIWPAHNYFIQSLTVLSREETDHKTSESLPYSLYSRCVWVLLCPPIEDREAGPTV